MKKTLTTLLSICAVITCNYAQIPKEPTAALSANAAGLGLYGDIPVSLYTGTPEISIPLCDISINEFSLPISLNYHAAGIQADQHPSWTGLGWSLFAGGVITRKINGIPDDARAGTSFAGGYYYAYNYLKANNWNTKTYIESIATATYNTGYNNNQASLIIDAQPDEFSFCFGNYSGHFYLDHNRNWTVQCNKPLKVEFDGTFTDAPFRKINQYTNTEYFSGFTIIAEDGTKYVFGKDTSAIDFSIEFYRQDLNKWVATAWYLTQIILPNGKTINFSYGRREFNNQMYIAVYFDLGTKTENQDWFDPSCSNTSLGGIDNYYSGRLISPVYLTEINTDEMQIKFNKSISNELRYKPFVYQKQCSYPYSCADLFPFLNGSTVPGKFQCLDGLKWYKLDSIEVFRKSDDKLQKKIKLDYSNNENVRLKLTSVKESGKNPYTFEYNHFEDLPDYLANKSDHWGYFNNTFANANIGNLSLYYNYRNANADYTKYGILKKIIYPTGGYTYFIFEAHYYRKQLQEERWKLPLTSFSSNQLAGGVRIKEIQTYDSENGSPIIKQYYYVSDYLTNKQNANVSSGIMGGSIRYYIDGYKVKSNNSTSVKYLYCFTSNSVLPACKNQLSHIGYTEVIEQREDNSFTRHLFSNFDNGYMDEQAEVVLNQTHTPYEMYNSKDQDRGLPLLTEHYNSYGKKVKSLNIEYEHTSSSPDYVRSIKAESNIICPGSVAHTYIEGSAYKIYTYTLRPKWETETLFDGSGNQQQYQRTTYKYNSKNLLSETSISNSKNQKLITGYVYPSDVNGGEEYNLLKKMTDKNMLSNYVDKITYIENGKVINAEHIKYKEFFPNIFKPERIDLLHSTNTAASSVFPSHSESKNLYIEANMSNMVIPDIQSFSILYGCEVNMDVDFYENIPGEVNDLLPSIRFIVTIKRNGYDVHQFTSHALRALMPYGAYTAYTQQSVYLAPGNYTVELMHTSYQNTAWANYNIDFVGYVNLSFTEQSPTIAGNTALNPEVYYKYNQQGNITEIKPAGSGIPTAYLWSYKGQYPIAEIAGAGYDEVKAALSESFISTVAAADSITESQLQTIRSLTAQQNFPKVQINTYTYKPLTGMLTATDPRATTTYYEYDSFGRLKRTYIIENGTEKTLQTYDYNYRHQ